MIAHKVGQQRGRMAAALMTALAAGGILVSAATRQLPAALLAQLGDPGRMVLPVAGRMTLVVRSDGDEEFSEHGRYRFVPLVESAHE